MTKVETPESVLQVIDPVNQIGSLKRVGGSNSDTWNNLLATQVLSSLWTTHSSEELKNLQSEAMIIGLIGVAPRDELEGMLAAQLIAAHNAAMECYRRAMIDEQPFEGRRENLTQANKLSRTYSTLLDTLNRHRGKGQQKVTVEHVHVHNGGQAIVGHVEGVEGRNKTEDQPHALRHAPGDTLRSEDTERKELPIARYAER